MKKNATGFIAVTALLPTNQRTALATGATKDFGRILPQMVMAVLDCRCTGADADETLDVVVQGSNDGVTWVSAAAFAQVTQPQGTSYQRVNIGQPIYRYYRAVGTPGGATPDFEYSVQLIGAHPTHAPIVQVD